MKSNGRFGNAADIGVGFSDEALLAASILGFGMLTIIMYTIIVRRLQTREEFETRGNDEMDYDAKLDHADIATLNRAQRRARAKNVMKRQRRIGGDEPGVDQNENNVPGEMRRLSRKERDKAAKATERQERKLCEDQRRDQQRQAQQIAQLEKKERDKLEAKRIEERRKLRMEAKELQEQNEYEAWKIFLSSGDDLMSVMDLSEYLKSNKYINIDDLSEQFRIPCSTITAKIRALVKDCRITGVFVDNGKRFLYLTHEELIVFAESVRRNGETTLEDLVNTSKMINFAWHQTCLIICNQYVILFAWGFQFDCLNSNGEGMRSFLASGESKYVFACCWMLLLL